MMQESPIDQRIWKYGFHCVAGYLTCRSILSLWNERRIALSVLDEPITELKAAKGDHGARVAALQHLDELLQSKKGSAKNAIIPHAKCLVEQLSFSDTANADVVKMVLKIIRRAFTSDADARNALHAAGGYRRVLAVLSEAHKQAHRSVMEDAALTLQEMVEVEDASVVLTADVPHGAGGAHFLCNYPSTPKMLRILDPSQPIVFLNAVTGILANLCTLYDGAVNIGKGTGPGASGTSYFLKLLSHGSQGIVAHAIRAIRYIARQEISHEEISRVENVKLLAALVDANKDPRIVNSVLTVFLLMTASPFKKEFFRNVEESTSALHALFAVWCRGTEKPIRDRAEILIHVIESSTSCSATIKKLTEQNRSNIMERKARDEEALKKQKQQMRQQQMMQQMMMQQMGGGGGGGGDMEEMMAMMGQ